MFILLLIAFAASLLWLAIDFLRDALLFVTPEETTKKRLHRKLGDGEAYDHAVRAIDRHKPHSIIALALVGLLGMTTTAWIIFG